MISVSEPCAVASLNRKPKSINAVLEADVASASNSDDVAESLTIPISNLFVLL